jgi:aminoglycoside/choline kinase family phosphotransferase
MRLSPSITTLPNPSIAWSDAARQAAFERWFAPQAERHRLDAATLRPASADASFRRYFRVDGSDGSCIVMDAPPPHEDVRPFVHVAGLIADAGLHGPQVLACDAEQGFLLLSDLGTTLYLEALAAATPREADALMRDAIGALVRWQSRVDPATLPPYDEALLGRELALFPDWCVEREYGLVWSAEQRNAWDDLCRLLIASARAQPQLAVHRDWMPRNLMVSQPNPGILDFQDAVCGPVTYDIACLLRDAFISWEEEREIDWAARYWEAARSAGLLAGAPLGDDFGEFWRALEWMGLQRHLKVLGIFCRLKHRDGKARYATDLPRFFGYALKVAARYRPLAPLLPLVEPLAGVQLEVGFTLR